MYKWFIIFILMCSNIFTTKATELDSLAVVLMEPSPAIGQQQVYSTELVDFAYQSTAYQYIWQNKISIFQALTALNNAWQEGLAPQDYHINRLNLLAQNIEQHINTLEFDVLLTDAVMTYATHLIRGRVNPNALSDSWNYQLYSVSPKKSG
jgi:murein L,D-transpeptidase YcbB/YkuD